VKQTLAITRKELAGYLASPMAIIFLAAFLVSVLFVFFWVDAFFARGIADVRPLFRWMPVLLIFLVATLTMRQWSEEQRAGTLEILLTLPVRSAQLIVGKFLAVLALVGIALALTLFLPVTVSMLGNMDWGPVVGGYLASMLLAAAYGAIGLALSSRTDNQIVALISTTVVCGLLTVVGSSGVTDFVGGSVAEVLRAIGSGSRFASIERGVVDLRDLLYYLSLMGMFLALNVLSLESKRWSTGSRTRAYRQGMALTNVLVVANLVLLNVWVFPLNGLRLDLTAQREYTLSPPTRELLSGLEEPLLIDGYFSERTHPLLAPLIPRIRDTLREYEIASNGKVELDIVDPAEHPEKEAEANQTYGIQPMPFQIEGRYEASIINSYFHVLIRYGDQSAVLGFQDLIEVVPRRDGSVDVRFRNLEYDLTSALKKVVYGFQSIDAILAALEEPVKLTLYVTPETVPEWLADVPVTVERVAGEIASASAGKLSFEIVNPDTPGSPMTRSDLYETYGLQPLTVSFFSDQTYYLHMVLEDVDQARIVYPSGELSEADIRTAIESALKRSSSGFLQVVGLWTPPEEPIQDAYGQSVPPLSTWSQLREALGQEYEVRTVDLTSGQVPTDVDVLVVVAPQGMSDMARFAIDQYMMRGGSVLVAAGNYGITYDQFAGGLGLQPLEDGLRDMLASYGVHVEQSLVLDPQNEPFPVTVNRQVGDMQVQEIQAIQYPFFIDVRSDGMASESQILANLPALTLSWSSPISIDEEESTGREVVALLRSSPDAWTQQDTSIQPNFDLYPEWGFPVAPEQGTYTLAVSMRGVFESYFKDKPLPESDEGREIGGSEEVLPPKIETSPETARLVVVGSSEFLDDVVFGISSSLMGDRYLNNLKLVQNAVAWSTEDEELLEIRARGTSVHVLAPLSEAQERGWEIANYLFALLALAVVAGMSAVRRRNEPAMELLPRTPGHPAVEEVVR
jgi:ABC-2 type transport system permease protein